MQDNTSTQLAAEIRESVIAEVMQHLQQEEVGNNDIIMYSNTFLHIIGEET